MADPGGPPPGLEPGLRVFLKLQGKERRRKRFVFKGLGKPLSVQIRCRFRETEDAPFAAYLLPPSFGLCTLLQISGNSR